MITNALEYAAAGGHLPVVKSLIKAGGEVTNQVLWEANENVEIVTYLLNSITDDTFALLMAAKYGSLEVVNKMLAKNPEKYVITTALAHAAGGGYDQIVTRLLQAGAEVTQEALELAQMNHHTNIVQLLLS